MCISSIFSVNLMSGFWGSLISALIGGFITYLLLIKTINHNKNMKLSELKKVAIIENSAEITPDWQLRSQPAQGVWRFEVFAPLLHYLGRDGLQSLFNESPFRRRAFIAVAII